MGKEDGLRLRRGLQAPQAKAQIVLGHEHDTLAGVYACGCIFAAVKMNRTDAYILAGEWQRGGFGVISCTAAMVRNEWGRECPNPDLHYKAGL